METAVWILPTNGDIDKQASLPALVNPVDLYLGIIERAIASNAASGEESADKVKILYVNGVFTNDKKFGVDTVYVMDVSHYFLLKHKALISSNIRAIPLYFIDRLIINVFNSSLEKF